MSACSGIYRSENQGHEWTKLQGIPYAARRTQTIVQDSRNPKILYAGTTEGAWVTRDAGETWSRTTPKDWVVNAVLVLPAGFEHAGRVILGTESGIYLSEDGGQTFAASNTGFRHLVVKQLVAGSEGGERLLMLVQRNGWELLESADQGRTWASAPLPGARSAKSPLIPYQVEEVYGSPWGWLLRMTGGQFWLCDDKTRVWREWKPRISPEMPRSKSSVAKHGASQRAFLQQIGPKSLAFTTNSAVVSSPQGLMRCGESGVCARLHAFTAPSVASGIWVSADGGQIASLQDGKLGLSANGGETASWRDLPVSTSHALWVDVVRPSGLPAFILGTSAGLFSSAGPGSGWVPMKNGIPVGRMEMWLADPAFWLVSERTGGLYLSWNHGESWSRIDGDAERGRFAGLVNLGNGQVLAGSQGEGLLRLEVRRRGN
jgi:photosystem II stability/assembly factor-like uncharacterized protein